jgi:hypothetical protein
MEDLPLRRIIKIICDYGDKMLKKTVTKNTKSTPILIMTGCKTMKKQDCKLK